MCRETKRRFLAHISEDGKREQTILEHLEGTGRLAEQFAEVFGFGSYGYALGKLHDIGKYSFEFQKRLTENGKKVDHATAGARLCWEQKGPYSPYGMLAYAVAGHHSGLPDTGGDGDLAGRGTLKGRMKKELFSFEEYRKEVDFPALSAPTNFRGTDRGEDPGFAQSFLIRMLYSCLVDADYLDTEAFMKEKVERDSGEKLESLLKKLEKHVSGWLYNHDRRTVNGRRSEILRQCLEKGTLPRGLFRLTVPTGGGKTISSLAFALRHGAEHEMKRVIYVIPYTSIIEQNAKIFSDILGRENVLEAHCNIDYESDEELKPLHLAAENWDKPVVVTTNVQFFESLFSNKSSKCRKLHNIADSVIIFDEAQMLPCEYLRPCIAAMEELLLRYRSTLVLCTATQPALGGLFRKSITWEELCPDREEQFQFFKRCQILNLGRIRREELIDRLEQEDQALCILNTKREVQEVYQELKERRGQSSEGEIFHLSTQMYPEHRKAVLDEIRKRTGKRAEGKSQIEKTGIEEETEETESAGNVCIVIATSLVEAGVDLDFASVYREMAGLDSAIQAAGRCNREGKRPLEESRTWIFDMEGEKKTAEQEQRAEVMSGMLEKLERAGKSLNSPEAAEEYFRYLYQFKGSELDRKHIMEYFRPGNFRFASAAQEFKMIEEHTVSLLIPVEESAEKIAEEIRLKGCSRKRMREAGRYSVSVDKKKIEEFCRNGIAELLTEGEEDGLYVLKRREQYSQEVGLLMEVETGKAFLM